MNHQECLAELERLRSLLGEWIDAATSRHDFGRVCSEVNPFRLREAIERACKDRDALTALRLRLMEMNKDRFDTDLNAIDHFMSSYSETELSDEEFEALKPDVTVGYLATLIDTIRADERRRTLNRFLGLESLMKAAQIDPSKHHELAQALRNLLTDMFL